MKPIEINLTTTISDELDSAIYGDFNSYTRDDDGKPYVKMKEGGEWIPVNDWKKHRYIATEDTLKRIARHFIEIGKHIKEQYEKED